MKKNLWVFAAAAVALAACSNDDTIAVNQGIEEANTISFNTIVEGQTRATATVLSTIQTNGFYVGAWKNADHAYYFADTKFTKDAEATTYHADGGTKYYWPSTDNLDFVGFYPNVDNTTLTHGAWNTFTFVPADANTSHTDYVIAATVDQAKAESSTGVSLAFKHLGTWIELKAYNSKGNAGGNMNTSVKGWKIGYVHKGGVYTISSSTANGSALSTTGSWNYDSYPVQASNVPNEYREILESAVTTTTDGACDDAEDAAVIGNAMIIVPQATTKITGSSTYNATGGYLTGAFIAVKLQITDGSDHIIADATGTTTVGETSRDLWAIWPINNDWADGNKYTYVIDLSQGGYKEIGTHGEELEKWLDGAEIFFNSVTVTNWATGTPAIVTP